MPPQKLKRATSGRIREAPHLEPPLSEREEAQGKPPLLLGAGGYEPSAEEAATCRDLCKAGERGRTSYWEVKKSTEREKAGIRKKDVPSTRALEDVSFLKQGWQCRENAQTAEGWMHFLTFRASQLQWPFLDGARLAQTHTP